MLFLRILVFLIGAITVYWSLASIVRSLVLPRGAPDKIAWFVFLVIRRIFQLRLKRAPTYEKRDQVMAMYAPVSMLMLLPAWYTLVMLGFTAIFWAGGEKSWYEAFRLSYSSLLTLGFASSKSLLENIFIYSEAILGLILVALLIAYLPTIYSAFQRREVQVTLLEVRAGNPPSAIEMLLRYHRIHGLDKLNEIWRTWETWFADIQESHTSLASLVFLRSPQAEHSWVASAGAVLDAASITLSTIDIQYDPSAALCIRAGYLAMRRISGFFGIYCPTDPHFPTQPISISRAEFEETYQRLRETGVPIKSDIDQAWSDFAGWRVNYDAALLGLARLTMAPPAPWSSDRIQPNTFSDGRPQKKN